MSTQNASAVAITGGSVSGITDLAVADGGTGSSSASGARTNLELGTMATQNANNVNITGGIITGVTVTTAPQPSTAIFVNRISSPQTITCGETVKVDFNNEEFDVAGLFDISTDTFTPTTEGYYLFSLTVRTAGTGTIVSTIVSLFKNGNKYLSGHLNNEPNIITAILYANGTTDYFDARAFIHPDATECFVMGSSSYGEAETYWSITKI
jgi:hypothetical protein